VVSRFPTYTDCGRLTAAFCVDPQDATSRGAISELLDNPGLLRYSRENGRKAVLREYHWNAEAKTLLRVYREVLEITSQI